MSTKLEPRARPQTEGVEILIVDDRREDLLALESVLAGQSYRVVAAASGRDALMKVLRHDFALILLDAHMPGMDGFEVATIIRQRERSRYTPIVFLTAAGGDLKAIQRAYEVGAVDYMSKPIDGDVVRAKVAIFVELFERGQRIREQAEALHEAARRQRELELAAERLASARRYRNLAEAIPQIVWTASADGAVTYCSHAWSAYTGLDGVQALGWGWTQVLHYGEAEAFERGWRDAIASVGVFEAQCQIRRHDDVFRWHLVRAVPERDADGNHAGWIGTYTDFHDLRQAHAAAEEAIRLRDEFLSIASHELRTPLTALQLQLETMRGMLGTREGDAASPVPDLGVFTGKLDRSVRQTGRLEKLIANLLDVSRIMAGKLSLELEDFDVIEVVNDVADRFAEEANRAGCKIAIGGARGVHGRWDRLRIEQVMTNLLSNAIKYAAGAPVEIHVENGGPTVRLSVQDHGIGIAEEDLTRIFGRFERAAPSRHYGGLGVGLYITQQIVAAHGGTIGVTSEVGRGSRFIVELPADNAAP